MRAPWLAAALLVACRTNLPDPVEPLARTPDAAFRRQAPERLPGAPPARLPPVRSERLPNGLLVVVATRPNSPNASAELVVRGAAADPQSQANGLAIATVYALAEAPEPFFSSDVQNGAASLGIHTDETSLDDAVRALADAALRPRFDEGVLNSTKSYLFRHIQSERTSNLIRSVAYNRLYAEPPPLLDTRGSVVHGVTEEAVKRHYETFYGPENAALIVASPASFERVLGLATKHFGDWKAGNRPAPKAPTGLPFLVPSEGPRPIVAVDHDKDMAHALLILPGPPKGFQGFAEYALTDVLFGSSLGSRANVSLRLHDAKTYAVGSTLEQRRNGSELQVHFAVEQDDLIESIERILGELERLRREPVSTEELDTAKIAWQARLSSRLVTSAGTAEMLRQGFALDGDPTALAAVVERVEKVVPSDIQGVARREFTPDRTQVVVFASRKRLEAALRRLGPIWWHEF